MHKYQINTTDVSLLEAELLSHYLISLYSNFLWHVIFHFISCFLKQILISNLFAWKSKLCTIRAYLYFQTDTDSKQENFIPYYLTAYLTIIIHCTFNPFHRQSSIYKRYRPVSILCFSVFVLFIFKYINLFREGNTTASGRKGVVCDSHFWETVMAQSYS